MTLFNNISIMQQPIYTQRRSTVDNVLENYPPSFSKLFCELAGVTEKEFEMINVVGQYHEKFPMISYHMFLIHPKKEYERVPLIMHTRGMVLCFYSTDSKVTGRVVAASIPLPKEEKTRDQLSEADFSGFQHVFTIEEGTYIRFFSAFGIFWASTNKDLKCLNHRWVENKITFGEAIENIAPGELGRIEEKIMSEDAEDMCLTYILRSKDTSFTNKVSSEYFKLAHVWKRNPENPSLLERVSTPTSFSDAKKMLENAFLGIFVYNPKTNIVISYNSKTQQEIRRLRGDTGNLIHRYEELVSCGDESLLAEFLNEYSHRQYLFTEFENKKQKTRMLLTDAWKKRYISLLRIQLPPNAHKFLHPLRGFRGSIFDVISYAMDELSPFDRCMLVDVMTRPRVQ